MWLTDPPKKVPTGVLTLHLMSGTEGSSPGAFRSGEYGLRMDRAGVTVREAEAEALPAWR